jgi:serine/threonine-protein kinase
MKIAKARLDQPVSSSGIGDAPVAVDGAVVVNENLLFPLESPAASEKPKLITELAGLEEERQLGASRFGTIRLLRRPNENGDFDCFAAKFYNPGNNREGRQSFEQRLKPFLELSHPHVMPIVGVIPPTKSTGPIFITPYSEVGSLEDVLDRVRRNDAPSFWNDCGKVRMIVSLVSGLHYLHSHGIVHRELKPADLIFNSDGTIRICGYVTSILEEHQFIRASQVNGPSYMAPEIYDDEHEGFKVRDPKTDVFSFGLIVYEIISGHKVFPSSMSAAVIMRRAMSSRPSDRSVIPSDVSPLVRELISRSWVSVSQKRPSFEALWKRMRDMNFKLFPGADVCFIASGS